LKHLGFVAFPITRGFSISPTIFPHNNTLILKRNSKSNTSAKILQILLSVSALSRFRIIENVMPILRAGTIEFVHIEQVSALFTFRLGQLLLYIQNETACHVTI
jgi:hypothetical protein